MSVAAYLVFIVGPLLVGLKYTPQEIRVNALASGYVSTQKIGDYWTSFPDAEAAKAATTKRHPEGQIATPDEIALTAVFMVSDECSLMNTTCLTVDGGFSVQHPAYEEKLNRHDV